jgi:heme O synthase-like polyprenyltransferase
MGEGRAATVLGVDRPVTIEHGSTRFGRELRDNRVKLAALLAIVEGVLVLVGAIDWWVVVLLAVGAVVLYVLWGRAARQDAVREATWIFAVSQLAVVLVPALVLVATAVAIVALVFLAVVALIMLLRDRR